MIIWEIGESGLMRQIAVISLIIIETVAETFSKK